jgi:tubulin-specific chaperone A
MEDTRTEKRFYPGRALFVGLLALAILPAAVLGFFGYPMAAIALLLIAGAGLAAVVVLRQRADASVKFDPGQAHPARETPPAQEISPDDCPVNEEMVQKTAELEAHTATLEAQKREMQKQNEALAETHRALAEKARQLELSSRYKTEFLANMSHELRTPLNSILLLSRLLMENKEKNLAPRQFEFARTIHSAGEDLLNLINEILDLAKVESGKMEMELAPTKIHAITRAMLVSFTPLAEQSQVAFEIHVAPDVPEELITDRKRVEQIIKNFLSNAFKFTTTGSVRLEIAVLPAAGRGRGEKGDNQTITISVVDTGIGIPIAKQEMVFEAFQQVDGSTRRKYGGTGLGLSISRELARMLGGKITLTSKDGRGSRFCLHLPVIPLTAAESVKIPHDGAIAASTPRSDPPSPDKTAAPPAPAGRVPDDRHRIADGDRSILVIEDDAAIIEPIKAFAQSRGYRVLVAEQFPTGLHFADHYLPTAVFVNVKLPAGDGWKMIGRIKANPRNRHIPVLALSAENDAFAAAIHKGAGCLPVPVARDHLQAAFALIGELTSKSERKILVAAPNREQAARIAAAVEGPKTRAVAATTSDDARDILASGSVQAVIIHPDMETAGQYEFLRGLENQPLPIFRYSGQPLPKTFSEDIGVSFDRLNIRTLNAPEQLPAALCAGLHLPLDEIGKDLIPPLHGDRDRFHVLKGRRVLLVDDDMRTVFAVSNALEDKGVEVVSGKTGKESLDKLSAFPEIDLVLMDVMIADVDGYAAIGKIRRQRRFQTLPIIALTARAMQGDRDKCIRAGADDYLAKPVNLDKLTSMLKIWLELQRADNEPSVFS